MKATILKKLLTILLLLTVIPLGILGYLAVRDTTVLGAKASEEARLMGQTSLASANEIGDLAVSDSKASLNNLAKEAIEVRAVVEAKKIADFLYERDSDILFLKSVPRAEAEFKAFLDSKKKDVIMPSGTVSKQLYKEIAFYDASLNEVLRVKSSGYDGKDYALDDFKSQVKDLKEGEILVGRLWGDYDFKDVAYAGVENPKGKMYEGYFRWVTPVYEGGAKIGYLSLKLDARHVMDMVQHISPTEKRFVTLTDAPSGNYAYLVDDEGWLITHAREFNMKGVMPDGTLPPPLSKDAGDPPVLNNTQPLNFYHLGAFSKELMEIHTLHTVNGESGSQIYPWAGLTKWIAYSTVPYYTGKNYADKAGFGWIAVGAQIDKFQEPATVTAGKINEKTNAQAVAIQAGIAKTEKYINDSADHAGQQTLTFIVIAIIIVVIVGYLFANSISKPIKALKESADKLTSGELDVKLPEVKGTDEIAELTGSVEMLMTAFKAKAQQTKQSEPRKK